MFRAVKPILHNPSRRGLGSRKGSNKALQDPGKRWVLIGVPEGWLEAVGDPGPKMDATRGRTGRAVWEGWGPRTYPRL